MSPAFPIGAYTCSHGLEWAVEAGDVRDEAMLLGWLRDLLAHGAPRADLVLLRHAWRARDDVALAELAELAEAACTSRERWEETLGQGAAFAAAVRVWGALPLDAALPDGCRAALPVVAGCAAAALGVAEDAMALAFLQSGCANLVSAAVRLVPLGQTAGLRVLAALETDCLRTAADTRTLGLDWVAGACFRSDLAAMRHETQHTRLFRT